jgi:hypothetical protein
VKNLVDAKSLNAMQKYVKGKICFRRMKKHFYFKATPWFRKRKKKLIQYDKYGTKKFKKSGLNGSSRRIIVS